MRISNVKNFDKVIRRTLFCAALSTASIGCNTLQAQTNSTNKSNFSKPSIIDEDIKFDVPSFEDYYKTAFYNKQKSPFTIQSSSNKSQVVTQEEVNVQDNKESLDTLVDENNSVESVSNIEPTPNIPNPRIRIQGQDRIAKLVVDLTHNVIYYYDGSGKPINSYPVASGKKSTPTHTGVRRITHVETYPYSTAPANSKRRQNPRDYGPKIICLETINPETGESLGSNGEFIHGTNNPNSVGKKVSHGCMRVYNDVIRELSTQVMRGDIVIIDYYE